MGGVASKAGKTTTTAAAVAAAAAAAAAAKDVPTQHDNLICHAWLWLQAGLTSLHMSANNGHLAVVEQLLRAGAAVDAAAKVGPSPADGVQMGHVVAASWFVCKIGGDQARQAGPLLLLLLLLTPKCPNTAWQPYLRHLAAAAGWLDCLAHGSWEWTPGCGAAAAGCPGCCGYLQPGEALTSGRMQMGHVVAAGWFDCRMGGVASKAGKTTTTAAAVAAAAAAAAAAKDVPTQYDNLICHAWLWLQAGLTSLHMSANNGHLAVVEQLLRAGAAVDAAAKVGPSPVDGVQMGHVVAASWFVCKIGGDQARQAGPLLLLLLLTLKCPNTAWQPYLRHLAAAAGWLDCLAHGSWDWTPGCGAAAAGCPGCCGCRHQGKALTSGGCGWGM
jgi:ribosomal protein S11